MHRAFIWLFVTLSVLVQFIPSLNEAQKNEEFTWKDGTGQVRTEKELKELIEQHSLWLQTKGKSGQQAIFSEADLTNADLSNVNLSETQLLRTNLTRANLHGATLKGINTIFSVVLDHADLSNTSLSAVRLTDAQLNQADLYRAIFEPAENPPPQEIAKAKNIEFLTYQSNPAPLALLRKSFKDGGFREEERKITYALKRREAELLWDSCIYKGKMLNCVDFGFNTAFFDWTTNYGMNPGRAVRLLVYLGLFSAGLYILFMYRSTDSGLNLVVSSYDHIPSWMQFILQPAIIHGVYRIAPQPLGDRNMLFLFRSYYLPIASVALFFSLMSAFNIGFRDINFGRWLRLLTMKEYDLKAVGWARTVSGLQALISVYFLAIWLLTYFGRPFE